MFTKYTRGRGVTSDQGFSVERHGSPLTQFVIRYIEGGHVLEYEIENLAPGGVDRILVNKIGPWLSPHGGERIEPQRQEVIARRICEAMSFLGDTMEVASPRLGH